MKRPSRVLRQFLLLRRLLLRVPLSYRVGAVSLALVAVLVFNALIALQSAQNVFEEQERLRAGVGAQHRIEMIVSHAKDLENGVRGYFISGDPRFLEPYERGRAALPGELRQLHRELGGDAGAAPQLAQFEQAVGSLLDQSQTFVLMRAQMRDGAGPDQLVPLVERQKERMDAVRDSAAALGLSRAQANDSLDRSSAQARRGARVAILVPSLISVLLTLFLSYLVIRDLRQRQAMERQREELLRQERQARAEAEAANQAKDDFVSTVSHELRTPLQAILGWTQFLARLSRGRDAVPAAQVATQLDTIERNARALARMIDDLLDVSRAITGKLSLATQRVDLAEIVRSSVDVSRPAAAAKSVQLELELSDAPLWMVGDADRLRQVAINVVGNGVKFTPAGGRVTVRVGRVGARLELRVADTGIGIAPELLPRIFERYVQGSVSSARQYGGLGLGLAIVKHLVELHGGQVAVRSAGLGRGSEFVLGFPILAVEPPQPAAVPRAASMPQPATAVAGETTARHRLAGLRLLVVDDEADVRAVLDSLFSAEGARVVSAASAEEAMERLRFQRMDAVLSDIGMPGTDGYALARRIRALRERESGTPPSVPLIAFTAFSREEDARRALDSGFDAHVAKPADLERLISVLRRCAGPSSHLPIEVTAHEPRR
ncbi:MAG TPA: ATP-binding protein [Nevskia sp.]|nr:ATP-binding protein [Nevskia sp.]